MSEVAATIRRELLVQVAPWYREATHAQQWVVLDEFLAAAIYARKYAIRLLAKPFTPPTSIRRPREARYGSAVREPLRVAWTATLLQGPQLPSLAWPWRPMVDRIQIKSSSL